MFSATPMLKLQVIAFARDTRMILQVIGRSGVMEFSQTPVDAGSELLPPSDKKDAIARCDNFLDRAAEIRRAMNIPQDQETSPLPEIIAIDAIEERLGKLEDGAKEFTELKRHALARREELNSLREQVAEYFGLGVSMQKLRDLTYLHFVIGNMPGNNLASVHGRHDVELFLLPESKVSDRPNIAILCRRQDKSDIDLMLHRLDFKPAVLPATADGIAEDWERDRLVEQRDIEMEIREIESSVKSFADEIQPSLRQFEYSARHERRLLEAEQNAACTRTALLFTGWVPAADASSLILSLRKATMNRCVIKTTAAGELPEEEIPVLLRYPRLLRPFESLLTAYGLPKYNELEPTLFVAITYILMFGFMFGDAGHGAVMVLAGLMIMLYASRPKLKDIGLLLSLGGCSSCCMGLVYGSYFGLPRLKKYALWHDPIEGDPIRLLQTAAGLGIIIISLGLILNMINRFRHGDVEGGILHKFGLTGILFYWGALAIGLKYAVIQSRGLLPWAIGLFLVLPLCIWVLHEPINCIRQRWTGRHAPEDSLTETIIQAAVETFETVLAYFANTVSFLRLAAYAMSHAALLMATFVVAAQAGEIAYAGTVLSILVIIGGNLVALVLEGVIASVQALRLEYYEFFSKFFSGAGKPFKPFCLVDNANTNI
ncbi:MAG: V-type ATPase 116kDa subunit family protein [Victivallales bacterium]